MGRLCRDKSRNLVGLEASQRQIKVQGLQIKELGGQKMLVPAGVQRQFVVRDHIGPSLHLGQVRQFDARNLGDAEQDSG